MIESQIEKYLKREVEKIGGMCWKFVSPGNAGVPDRLVILPNGDVHFVELKNGKQGRLSSIQMYMQRKLSSMNAKTCVLISKQEIDAFIQKVGGAR